MRPRGATRAVAVLLAATAIAVVAAVAGIPAGADGATAATAPGPATQTLSTGDGSWTWLNPLPRATRFPPRR